MKCECCQTNETKDFSTSVCSNCWEWLTTKMTINDVCVVIGHIAHREPDNKYAKAISEYVVADNYMQGKAKLRWPTGSNHKVY